RTHHPISTLLPYTTLFRSQFRNSDLMDELADVILHDDLTWSHPDKMTIVEYPLLSDSQQHERNLRDLLLEDVFTGKDDVTIGRKDRKSTRLNSSHVSISYA